MLSSLFAAAFVQSLAGHEIEPQCVATSSRLRATHGYFGLTETAPAGAIIATAPEAQFTSHVANSLGEGLGYSRVHITFTPCRDVQVRNYHDESRGWLSRLFVGLKTNKALKVRVSLLPQDVSKDTSLTRIDRQSSKNGDVWDTDITESAVVFPYFRVGQSTIITITPSFLASSDYSSEAGAQILSFTERAAELINPATTLVTTENKERFTKAASFVDETINGLLRRSVKEEGVAVRIPTRLRANGEIAKIVLFSPTANRTVEGADLRPMGVWTITVEPLIASLFGTVTNERLNAGQLSPSTILGFRLVDNKTLQEALLSRSSITVARDAYLQAKTTGDKAKAGAQFCNLVANEAGKMWFAPVDAGAAAWAMATELAPDAGARKELMKACETAERFPTGER